MIPELQEEVRRGLTSALDSLRRDGLPMPTLDGKLLRPMAAYGALPRPLRPGPGDAFWMGALALEMVHEASLLHDDILDGAAERRGAPTVAARQGPGRALVQGDHLLTGAYRAAAAAGLPSFLEAFIRAVERTVEGEIRQGMAAGARTDPAEYRAVLEGKSGELFGAALALAAARSGGDVAEAARRGRRLGALYQMVDDFLDYCPSAVQGKPPLQDLRQGKWTFVLEGLDLPEDLLSSVGPDPIVFAGTLLRPAPGGSALRRALARLEEEGRSVRRLLQHPELDRLVDGWLAVARDALAQEEARQGASESRPEPRPPSAEAWVAARAALLGEPDRWLAYFARHGRTFRFASYLFPTEARRTVEGVYAFCRFTDDLVDEHSDDSTTARGRLEAWRSLAEAAYGGLPTGVPLLDRVMGEMRAAEVPFRYVHDLLDGVATDLEPVRMATVAELRAYTYRVASVVGGWMTELFGVHDPGVLARAFGLGHAMQLTNIVRDVGEDWRRNRLYLPADLRERHGVDEATVAGLARGQGPVPDAWKALMEDLMARADQGYDEAFRALPALPAFYARPVAVAARTYQGIHDALRRNDYDNGRLRAHTRGFQKLRLGVRGLMDLRRARVGASAAPSWTLAAQDG